MEVKSGVSKMIFHAKYSSRQAGELLTRSSTEVPDTETTQDNDLSLLSQPEFLKHLTEMNQDIKCTVNEISQIKDRISSLENEIKTLKLFPWF